MTDLSSSLAELKTLLGQCEAELQSLLAGKKASAPRVRSCLQKIKTLSHSMRSAVMTHVKELPVQTRGLKKKTDADDLPPSPPKLERQVAEVAEPKPRPKTRGKTSKNKTV